MEVNDPISSSISECLVFFYLYKNLLFACLSVCMSVLKKTNKKKEKIYIKYISQKKKKLYIYIYEYI